MAKTNIQLKRLEGLTSKEVRQFGDIIVKANFEQLIKMSEICVNEGRRRAKRGVFI